MHANDLLAPLSISPEAVPSERVHERMIERMIERLQTRGRCEAISMFSRQRTCAIGRARRSVARVTMIGWNRQGRVHSRDEEDEGDGGAFN